jgi:hypothetical protein
MVCLRTEGETAVVSAQPKFLTSFCYILIPHMLENTLRKIEYHLDILSALIGAHVEVILHSVTLILLPIKHY